MLLNNMPDISTFFHKIRTILNPNGKVVLIIPHPCFWPIKHIDSNGFQYALEKEYVMSFSTKGRKDYGRVSYFHRSLETYLEAICQAGFEVTTFCELLETNQDSKPDLLGLALSV